MEDQLFSDQAAPQKQDDSLFSEDPAPQAQSEGESFARGALRNFPFGQQIASAVAPINPLSDKSNYTDEMAHLTQKAEQAKEQNKMSYYTGAATGNLAPLAVPFAGEAGEAAAAAMDASPIITNGALGAANSLSDSNLTKNPLQNLEDAGKGAVIGGATAYGLGKILPGVADKLDNASSKSAVKSAMLNRNYLGHLEPEEVSDLGAFMKEHGLVNSNTQEALEQAKIIKDAYGNAIGQMGADAQTLANPKDYIKQLAEKAEKYEGRFDPEFGRMASTYDNAAKELKGLGKNPTFAQLQELKSIYGDHAFNADHSVANKAAADVYFTLKEAMNKIVSDAPGDYAGALKGYSYSNEVLNGLSKKLGTERAGSQGIGMGSIGRVVRQLPGPVRAAAGIGATMAGHPYIGAMAALPEIMNPALHSQVLSGAASGVRGLSKAAQLELGNVLESKFGKKKP
jgi:hypothetical protein